MGDDQKAFNEVRALLSKLDRSIDEARTKRVGPKDEPQNPGSNGSAGTDRTIGSRPDLDQRIGGSRPQGSPAAKPIAPPPIQAKRSQYGRARPLNRSDEAPTRHESENQWQSPKNYDDLSIG